MTHKDDYSLDEKIKITFKGMPYFIMPRYQTHYVENEYEKFSLQILKNNLDAKKVFLDIGSHYGAYSLYAAKSVGSHVYALEPVNENFELLNLNVKTNKLDNLIKTYNYAASDHNGTDEFNIPWASDSAGFYEHPNAETIKKQKVEVVEIDKIFGDKQVDFIKIDTEGHEVSVLNGLQKTLKNNSQTKLIIEINPECLERAGKTSKDLIEQIEGLNKDIYLVDENNFSLIRLSSKLANWQTYLDKHGYANLYCIPKITNNPYPLLISHSPRLDGAEHALIDLACSFRDKGILSHVVVPKDGPLENALIEKGISNCVVDGYTFWLDHSSDNPNDKEAINYLNMKAAAKITEICKELYSSAVLDNTMVNPWGFGAAKSLGLPFIWYVHEFGDIDHDLIPPHDINLVRDFIVKESDLVLCCSDAVKKSLLTGDTNIDKKIHTIYNLMDLESIEKKSKEKIDTSSLKGSGSLKLCMVGRIKEKKGQSIAINSMRKLKQKGINTELLLIGEGTTKYLTHLKKLIRELDLESNVLFLGNIANPYPYMRLSDAVLVCAENEAFGRTTVEAMTVGTIVIGSESGGTTELITNNKTGILFEPNNPEDLALKIEKLKTLNVEQIEKEAYENITSKLNPDKLVNRTIDLITGIKLDSKKKEYEKIINTEWVDAINYVAEHYESGRQSDIEQKDTIDRLTLENNALKSTNELLSSNYKSVIESKSWKVTKPLRKSNIIKKIKH